MAGLLNGSLSKDTIMVPCPSERHRRAETARRWDMWACRVDLLLPVRVVSSCMLKEGVTLPSHARHLSCIQVRRTAGGNLWSKIIRVGMKIPRGGSRDRIIVSLEGLFLNKNNPNN